MRKKFEKTAYKKNERKEKDPRGGKKKKSRIKSKSREEHSDKYDYL
jgi:hypothetical protein